MPNRTELDLITGASPDFLETLDHTEGTLPPPMISKPHDEDFSDDAAYRLSDRLRTDPIADE